VRVAERVAVRACGLVAVAPPCAAAAAPAAHRLPASSIAAGAPVRILAHELAHELSHISSNPYIHVSSAFKKGCGCMNPLLTPFMNALESMHFKCTHMCAVSLLQ